MSYVKTSDNNEVIKFPYHISDLKHDNPNTSFPKEPSNELLSSFNMYPVTVEDVPEYDIKLQNLSQDDVPTLVGGSWSLGWQIEEKTSSEMETYTNRVTTNNRSKRDLLLLETDWWASSDLTMTAEQTAYRQALRDISSHANWPYLEEADWPTKP